METGKSLNSLEILTSVYPSLYNYCLKEIKLPAVLTPSSLPGDLVIIA